jgi:hypothetical protein
MSAGHTLPMLLVCTSLSCSSALASPCSRHQSSCQTSSLYVVSAAMAMAMALSRDIPCGPVQVCLCPFAVSPPYPPANVSLVPVAPFGCLPSSCGGSSNLDQIAFAISNVADDAPPGSSHDSMGAARDRRGDSLVVSSAVRPPPPPQGYHSLCAAVRFGDVRKKQAGLPSRTSGCRSRRAAAVYPSGSAQIHRPLLASPACRRPPPARNTRLADVDAWASRLAKMGNA